MKCDKSKPINDQLLRSWIRCRRKAWLEIYGDKQKKLWTAHSTLQLNHQIDCFHNLSQKNCGIGIQACEEGKSIAYGIRLKYPLIKNLEKIKSFNIEKLKIIENELIGVKGQYLLFKNNYVLNIRKYTGYNFTISLG